MGDDFPIPIPAKGPGANATVLQRNPSATGCVAKNRGPSCQHRGVPAACRGADSPGSVRSSHSCGLSQRGSPTLATSLGECSPSGSAPNWFGWQVLSLIWSRFGDLKKRSFPGSFSWRGSFFDWQLEQKISVLANRYAKRFCQFTKLPHQLFKGREIDGLQTIRHCLVRIRVDFQKCAMGPAGEACQGHWRNMSPFAGAMAWVDHHRKM